jgi:SpoVK/Ycf46/Vps4 family AAA+-type ATPase
VVRGEVGAGERALWETFADAKRRAPSVVFIDEFQAAFTARSGGTGGGGEDGTGALLTAALAACMDDVERWNAAAGPASSVTVLAATNEPWAVDEGFLRPGRLDQTLYVGTLEVGARRALLSEALALRGGSGNGRGEEASDAEMEAAAVAVCGMTAGFTGADLSLLVQRASLDVLRATIEGAGTGAGPMEAVTWASLLAVLRRGEVKPSVTWQQEDDYHNWGKTRY